MKIFKQICLMMTMLGGSSAFGMACLKSAFYGGLAGGVFGLCAQKLNGWVNGVVTDIKFYNQHFCNGDVGQFQDLQILKQLFSAYIVAYSEPRADKSWFDKAIKQKSEFYHVECVLVRNNFLPHQYDMTITSRGIEDLHKKITEKGDSVLLKEMYMLPETNTARQFIESAFKKAQRGYRWKPFMPFRLSTWNDFQACQRFLGIESRLAAMKRFAVAGALSCMALKHLRAR